ncbi:MAG: VOC family protein [Acidobacteriota bacterium]
MRKPTWLLATLLLILATGVATAAQEENPYEGATFKRVTLVVADLDRALTIYRDILGFHLDGVSESGPDSYSYPVFKIDRDAKIRFATLSAGTEQVRTLALTEVRGMELPEAGRPLMSAAVIRSRNLERDFERLEALGLETTAPKFVTGQEFSFWERAFIDYDGHLVVLYEIVESEKNPAASPPDALAPKTSAVDALAGPLAIATYLTHDLDTFLEFYRDGLGLSMRGPLDLEPSVRRRQATLWGLPDDLGWDLYLLERPGAPGTVRLRLIHVDRPTPLVHTTYDAREPGPFSTGYPTLDLPTWDAELRQAGHDAMNPMSEYTVPRPDGTKYRIQETIFKAPDFMHAVGISRLDGMSQLGPVDSATGRGGPVYSAQSIRDSDAVLAFYTDVLGMELRSDREWRSHGSKGALAVPDGTVFRFSIVYAMGARDGHLLFIDFRDGALPDSGVAPRPPNQGMVAWSFPTQDLDEILRRAHAAGTEIVAGPVQYESPELGTHRAVTLLAPNGFLIEIFEPAAEADTLSATDIVERAILAAGGEAWRRPQTLRLAGQAVFSEQGDPRASRFADRYRMWRVFPDRSGDAHTANGKVRLEAWAGDDAIFQTAYDGQRTYDANGPVDEDQARRDWSSAFGFGILRFALDQGFTVDRLLDDQIEGHPCHFVRVTDPAGSATRFAIDRHDYSVRWVGFDTPKGWHHRIYSDFRWHRNPHFRQPTRVRLYYNGTKTADIHWQEFAVNQQIDDKVFVLP